MDVLNHPSKLLAKPTMARNFTFTTFKPHIALRGVEPAVSAVLVVDQTYGGQLPDVRSGGEGGFFHEGVVARVDGHRRHADLVQPLFRAAAVVVVELVLEAVNARDVGLIEGPDRVARANRLDVEGVRELLVLQLSLGLERLQKVLFVINT